MFGLGINKLGTPRGQALTEPETLLFSNAEEGTFLDFTSSQVYADTAGTDPAEVGEGTALVLDKSQGANDVRRNLLTYTEDFSNAAWLKLNSGTGLAPVLTPNFAEAPDGTMTAWRLQLDIDGGSASADQSNIRQGFTAVAPVRSCYMKLNSGSNTTIALNLSTPSANVVVTNEWQRLSSSVAGTLTIHDIGLRGNIATSKAADILIWHPQVEEGATATPYQKITTGINGEWTPGTHSTQATSTARPVFARVPVGGRRNLLAHTEDFSNAAWVTSNATITVNATTAPDGTLTADKLVENVANSSHFVRQDYTGLSATVHIYSVFAKAGERNWAVVLPIAGGTNAAAWFDLAGGVVGAKQANCIASSIQPAGDGWFRCSMSWLSTGTLLRPIIALSTANSQLDYLGDGTSGIYIWGAQLEVAS